MSDIKVYCVVRRQRGYNYDNFEEMEKIFDFGLEPTRKCMPAFTQFWKSIFKYPYASIRKELMELCFESIRNANFDRVYWCLEEFVLDIPSLKEDVLVYFTDDDDWVRSDAPQIIKKNYVDGYDGIVWTHVRICPFTNAVLSPNVDEITDSNGKRQRLNFSPQPYIQTNHCVVKYPTDPTTRRGLYIPALNYQIPVAHYCINFYLHEPGRKFLYINEVLSIYNSTPASVVYYEKEYMTACISNYTNMFEDGKQKYYDATKRFVEGHTCGAMDLFPPEFEGYLNRTKSIFQKCL